MPKKIAIVFHNRSIELWLSLYYKTAEEFKKILSDIDMLFMVEKDIRGDICHSFYQYAKANNKYMKDCDKNKE